MSFRLNDVIQPKATFQFYKRKNHNLIYDKRTYIRFDIHLCTLYTAGRGTQQNTSRHSQ